MSQHADTTTSPSAHQMVAAAPCRRGPTGHLPLKLSHHLDSFQIPSPSPVIGIITSTPNPFRKLPVEIMQHVLSALPDIDSVANARASCRQLNNALLGSENAILKTVLRKELGDLSSLHPEAIKALRIPVNSKPTRDLASIVSALPVQDDPIRPFPWREQLLDHVRAAIQSKEMMRSAPLQPEDAYDPTKGPYSVKRALEIAQVHKAHQRLTNMYFETWGIGSRRNLSSRPPEQEPFETALWRFEHFCRLFGSQQFYKRWGPSIRLNSIVETYWEGFTGAEIGWVGKVHHFLAELLSEAVQEDSASEGPCPHPKPPDALRCESCDKCSVEGAISTGLVRILDQISDKGTVCRRRHPFFLGYFLKGKA